MARARWERRGVEERPRLLFAAYSWCLDPSSGAALATRDLLGLLLAQGWDVRALCGPGLDFLQPESLPQVLADQESPVRQRQSAVEGLEFSVFHCSPDGYPVAVLAPSPPGEDKKGNHEARTREVFVSLARRTLEQFRPHVLLTYGGRWPVPDLVRLARQQGTAVVFALHNFEYHDPAFFQSMDGILVPSEYCAEHYRRSLGLRCEAISSPLNWARVFCGPGEARRYVTFINPQPTKGVFVFARIAQELGRTRPDIPLLVVEGRAGAAWLARTGVDLGGHENLHRMANTPDPRDFYRVSRVVLVPSLWRESFGRVAAEALLNGIPVLASRRGALPEVLREAGFLFDVPPQYTPESRLAPTAEEVAPWVEAVVRLFSDDAFYEAESRRCVLAAEAWRPERLAPRYDEFFRRFVRSRAKKSRPKTGRRVQQR